MARSRPLAPLFWVFTLVVVSFLAPALPAGASEASEASEATVTSADQSLIVEPDDGIAPIDTLLASPRHRLDLVMYELVDPTAEGILEADAARGVVVRVILDQNREKSANTVAYRALAAHGVAVVWAATSFEATHEKAMAIDAGSAQATGVIMTLNLTSRYYSDTRDVAVVDRNAADVAALESAFSADLAAAQGRGQQSTAALAHDLVWSPGSQPALLALIGSATTTLLVENEELSDHAIVEALEAVSQRNVQVTVVMTQQAEYADELADLRAAGARIRLYPDRSPYLYIHAKVIVVDGRRAFVGSENFTTASLDRNREVGLVATAPAVVTRLASMVTADGTQAPQH